MTRRLTRILKNERKSDVSLRLLAIIARIIVPNYRFKWTTLDWWENQRFNSYLNKFGELRGFNSDRRWMLWELLRLVESVPGETAECGVFTGASSYLICLANQKQTKYDRCHYMFDSFEGLSNPSETDGTHWEKGELSYDIGKARKNLSQFDRISFHPGWIPTRFPDVEEKNFAFVHIDVDLYEPTRDSIAFFYPRLHPGGVIVCDDYGSSLCPGATRAINEYLKDKPEKMLYLPDGAGFLIKGKDTTQDYFFTLTT